MKKIYLAALLNIAFINLEAQNFDWAKREGKYEYDYGYGISTDVSGNVYVAGKYEQNAIFSGTTLPNAGNHDMYLVKYASDGTLIWIRTAGGILGDYAHAMTCDHTSSVYVAGEIEGSGAVISFPGSSITLTAQGDNDVFVAKYDLNGTLQWAKSEGSSNSEKALGVTYDAAGNVYICGYFTDFTKFNGVTINGGGMHDMFIAKYNSAGAFQWMKHAGGPGREEALSIKSDPAGNLYVCGMYSDSAVFESTVLTTPLTPTGHYLEAFVAKYDASGNMQWIRTGGGDYDDVAWSLTMDNAGKIYVSGEFNAYALFGTQALTSTGNADAFVTSYDASGVVQWATKCGGVLVDRARGIGTDGNNLYITGQYGSTGVFGTSTQTAADSSDIFIAGLSNTGTFLWSKSVGGMPDSLELLGYESGNAVCADGPNTIYVTGALLDGGTFGVYSFSDYARTDMFVAKINMLVGIDEVQNAGPLHVYPNPGTGNYTIDASDIKADKFDLEVYNYLGELVEKQAGRATSSLHVDISSHDKGIYFVEIRTADAAYREKIILQ